MDKNFTPVQFEVKELKESITELNKGVNKLTKQYSRYNTYYHNIFIGISYGFGAVIGATILVSLLLFVLTQLAQIDILKPLIEKVIDIINSKNTR